MPLHYIFSGPDETGSRQVPVYVYAIYGLTVFIVPSFFKCLVAFRMYDSFYSPPLYVSHLFFLP